MKVNKKKEVAKKRSSPDVVDKSVRDGKLARKKLIGRRTEHQQQTRTAVRVLPRSDGRRATRGRGDLSPEKERAEGAD